MAIFKKKPEARSWSGQTAGELSGDANAGKGSSAPNDPCKNGHRSPVEYGARDEKKRIKHMSCQACGVNWNEIY